MSSPYKITIPMYEGPLDLLLDLIKKQEMNIHDIQISKITSQYLDYLHQLEVQNVDVSAATRGRYITPTYSLPSACTGGTICSPWSQNVVPTGMFIQFWPAMKPIGLLAVTMLPVSSALCVICACWPALRLMLSPAIASR